MDEDRAAGDAAVGEGDRGALADKDCAPCAQPTAAAVAQDGIGGAVAEPTRSGAELAGGTFQLTDSRRRY